MVARIRIECAELMPSDAHFFLSCVKKSTDISPSLQNQKNIGRSQISCIDSIVVSTEGMLKADANQYSFLPLLIVNNKHINPRKECITIFYSSHIIWV